MSDDKRTHLVSDPWNFARTWHKSLPSLALAVLSLWHHTCISFPQADRAPKKKERKKSPRSIFVLRSSFRNRLTCWVTAWKDDWRTSAWTTRAIKRRSTKGLGWIYTAGKKDERLQWSATKVQQWGVGARCLKPTSWVEVWRDFTSVRSSRINSAYKRLPTMLSVATKLYI